jgi:alpha-tubulin suppressor-like RCC1 family protein
MPLSNFNKDDAVFGSIDLDDEYITDAWLVDKFVGNNLWTWGFNVYGALGDGTTARKSTPIQVGSLTNWKQVVVGYRHTAAVKTDGTLWTCGYNGYGQLGDGTTVDKSSPIQVGSLTNWKQVAGGHMHTAAVKTDGTLWTWGDNYMGELGDGTGGIGTNKSSPIRVGLLTNWKQVAGGGAGGGQYLAAVSSPDLP